jgi:thiamine biosynthesis lipoprotein
MMTKRIFSALLAAALSLSLLAGCGSASGSTASSAADGPQRYSTVFYDVFDTVTQVIAYCDSEEEFTAQMDALHADLVEYNQLYDIYNDYDGVTNIKTINDNAGIAPVTVDDKILGMLELAQTMYKTTGGKLNIALGSVLNIWHNYREAALADDNDSNNQLPTQEELDAAAQHCDIANLIIDEDAKTVYLADPAMSLDVGSVGKGYAVEMVAQAAEARGLKSALISVGGNLRAIGTKPDGSQWSGGVENPWNASDVYTASSSYVSGVNMSDMALVTSGNYQRYYVVDGVRYHHLIDPDTLWPARYFDSVSVLSPDSGAADCLTTGLFCMSLEDGQKLIESLDGVEALWCTPDGEVIQSSGWADHEKK